MTFNQVYESEAHYRAVHVHSCSVCRKSLPSNHLLHLHIQVRLQILYRAATMSLDTSLFRPSIRRSVTQIAYINIVPFTFYCFYLIQYYFVNLR